MPPSEGQEPRALIVAVQAIDGRKCAETAKVHPDLRIVYNLAYGVLADEAGRFPVTGNYTTRFFEKSANHQRLALFFVFQSPGGRSIPGQGISMQSHQRLRWFAVKIPPLSCAENAVFCAQVEISESGLGGRGSAR